MSPIATAPPFPRALRIERAPAAERVAERRGREPIVVFSAAFALYAVVGLYATLGLDIVVGDAEARLAHAYFVWWDDPGKLTAIGFYWPPLQTLVLLPFALVKPLAVSLAALPLSSALFGALLVAVVDRAIALTQIDRALRWVIVAAFALNPMIVFYSGNGMAESLYLLLLTAGLYFFVRWWLSGRWQDVTLAGVSFGLGVVSRYEVAAWLAIVVFGALAVDAARRRTRVSIEASLLVLLVPTVYFLTLWTYLTGAITGSPLYWFTALAPRDRGLGAELDLGVVTEAVAVQAGLFPPTLLLAALALAVALRRRQPVAAVVAVALLVDLVATIVFVMRSGGDPNYFQLRYNLRAIPVAFVAVAVLLALVPQPRRRIAGVVAAVALVAAAPATALTMSRYGNALGEAAFVEGVFTGRGQDGVAPPRGTGNSVAKTRETARFLLDRADRPSSILTDDAHTYAVMLATGRPDLFFDRIDAGDDRWTDVAERPQGVVDFLLVNLNPLRADLLVALHPGLRGGASPPSFARLVFSNGAFAVYEVGR